MMAKGSTRQVFTDLEGNLILNQPAVMWRFYAQWQDQLISE